MEHPANFTDRAQKTLDAARDEARKMGRGHVGTEHLLLALSNQDGSPGAGALRKAGVDLDRLRKVVTGMGGRTTGGRALAKATGPANFTQLLRRVLAGAAMESRGFNHPLVGIEHLWLALLRDESSSVRTLLGKLKVDADLIRNEVLTALRPVQAITADTQVEGGGYAGTEFSPAPQEGARPPEGGTQAARQGAARPVSALATFGRDLTERARQGKLDPVIGREIEIARLQNVLCLRGKSNAVLIGEAGVGKTAVVEGLAQRIFKGTVPEQLVGKRIIQIDPSGMVAGTKYRGEFESRMKALIEEVRRSPDVIIFIDELHMVVGAGRAEGSADAANIMKPALSRGELRCIGATTIDEYNEIIEKDKALKRRFHPVLVGPPSIDASIAILKHLRTLHEAHHGVQITDSAVEAAVRLSERYMPTQFLPDKAIDLMDEAGVYARNLSATSAVDVTALKADLDMVRIRIGQALSEENPAKASAFRREEIALTERMKQARQAGVSARPIVTDEVVMAVLASITKIPLGKIADGEGHRLLNLEEHFRRSLIGQEPAVVAVAKALRRARTGLRDSHQPIASLLFVGPTGVGKTELAKQVATEFCTDKDDLIRFDMSEYMEKHSAASLIGSPQGYVGNDRGGLLTEAVRRKPHCVVLFDEIEKAHPDVLQLLLQVMEDGKLTDTRGRAADFSNTVIILTTNVGSSVLTAPQAGMGFGAIAARGQDDYSVLCGKALGEVKKVFKPEFLNRLTEVVVFRTLNRNDLTQILDLELAKFAARALTQKRVTVNVEPETKTFILDQCSDMSNGARPLRRAVDRYLSDGLGDALLSAQLKEGDCVIIAPDENGVVLKFHRVIPVSEQRSRSAPGAAPAMPGL